MRLLAYNDSKTQLGEQIIENYKEELCTGKIQAWKAGTKVFVITFDPKEYYQNLIQFRKNYLKMAAKQVDFPEYHLYVNRNNAIYYQNGIKWVEKFIVVLLLRGNWSNVIEWFAKDCIESILFVVIFTNIYLYKIDLMLPVIISPIVQQIILFYLGIKGLVKMIYYGIQFWGLMKRESKNDEKNLYRKCKTDQG